MTHELSPRFALPGTWGRVNLDSDATTQRSIRRVVEHSLGRDDNLATLRADVRKRFREAADIARASAAIDFYVSLEIAPGVPLPAWLAVFLPNVAREDFDSLGLSDLMLTLDESTASATGAESVASGRFESGKVQAVRQVFHRTNAATDDEPATELLQVDYWLAASRPNRIALLSFTTQLIEFEEQMLDLFDAAISTVRWPSPSPAHSTAAVGV
jgi:hypothetical protein